MRRFLRSAAYPPSAYNKYRASCISKWNWCAEQSRHLALGMVPEEVIDVAEIGTIGHQILEETMGRRFPWENQFFDELEKYQDSELGFVRGIETAKIYYNLTGHYDDLQITIDKCVSVVEHKFVKNPNLWYIQRYKLPTAQFQTQIYAWILEPIVEQLGGVMHRAHAVCYWNLNTFQHIHNFYVIYQPVQTQENILRCIKAYENTELIIPPKEWKCNYCSPVHKELCQFEKKRRSTQST